MTARRFPFGYQRFHSDANINYQLNRFLSTEPVGRVAALAARIHTYADWKSVLLEAAQASEVEGRLASAASLYRAAEFFMTPGDPDKERAYDRFVELFWLSPPKGSRLEVPYEGGTLPVLHLGTRRPGRTIVIHPGFDAFLEELCGLGEYFAEAGFEVILFEGPGQGRPLIKDRLPMTPEWERPVGAVLDHLNARDVTLIGVSLGGYLAPRAAAFEARVSRVVAFDVMFDFFECSTSHAGGLLRAALPLLLETPLAEAPLNAALHRLMSHDLMVDWGIRQGMHVTGARSPADFLQRLRAYHLREVSSRIIQDFLLMAGKDDHHVPLEQFYAQARALTSVRSLTARLFTSAEQASSHCQYGNLDLACAIIRGWVEERLSS